MFASLIGLSTQIKVEHKQKSPNNGSRIQDKPITAGATSVEEQIPAGLLMKLATNTVFAIRVAKNARVRSVTAEQHKHRTVGLFMFKQWAQQRMDIMKVIEPRTSPLLAAPDRGAHDSKPTAAAKIVSLLSKYNMFSLYVGPQYIKEITMLHYCSS